MRPPIATGQFYAQDRELLAGEIAACYEGQRGPGSLPLSEKEDTVRAIIAPNSPYRHAGQCMAWAYKRVAETPRADVYIILAPNRVGGETATTLVTYSTPLQEARIDQELAKALVAQGNVVFDDDAHARETSVEVQLPFLQHALGREAEHIKILPILIGDEADPHTIALDIKEALTETKRNPIFIVSSGLTRYGPAFHYVPFASEIPDRIDALDVALVNAIKAQDADALRSLVETELNPVDGVRCMEILMRVLRPSTVAVEQMYASGDVLHDWKNSVTYAAIAFREK